MKGFKELGISEELATLLDEANIREPTEIQEKTIPLLLEGKDVIAASHTGSGKTLAFGLVMIQNIKRGAGIQGLVLTPTRELALQVSEAIKKFSGAKHLKIAAIYGGTSIQPQMRALQNADIVVGTPGRLLDHLNRRTLDLRGINLLVLDEADMMLDMGFLPDVEKIISRCPSERQTLLFSATMPDRVTHLSRKYLNTPVKISTEAYVDPRKLQQTYFEVNPDDMKFSLLAHLLKEEHEGLIMVFCNTRRIVDSISGSLKEQGINSIAIHGGLTQSKRDSVMERFHAKTVEVLVCTDVAARGLDISGVSHVYNYDNPKDDNDYVHRIGRTARAGKEGRVINLITRRDFGAFKALKKNLGINVTLVKMPEIEKVKFIMGGGERRGGFRGDHGGGFRGQRSGGFRGGKSNGFRGNRFRSSPGGRFVHRTEGSRPEVHNSEPGAERTGGYHSGHNREERGERKGYVPGGRREGGYHSERRSHEDNDSSGAEGGSRARTWRRPRSRMGYRSK